ncbi:MAG: metal ABC transporter ATP-binding protein [Planctomycetes bacterium]|nr:metal ABC transporter ATP-binding protein [Planctomycetota bacterium]
MTVAAAGVQTVVDGSREPLLEFHDVTVAYGRRPVVWHVDLAIDAPCLFGIIGPNGAGKSTLLKAALGLVPVVGGRVRFFGAPLDRVRPRVGYVPQRETVDWDFPVSVMDVVLMGTYARLGWFRRPGSKERRLAAESLDRVGLADLVGRQIGRLSGGQQQRVFLARALAQQADVYLLDEPMAGVDVRSQEEIFRVLGELRRDGRLVVVVHHDLRTAAEWFDRAALIDMRLVASGPTAEVLTPDNLRRTYAGQLEILDEVGRAVAERGRTS